MATVAPLVERCHVVLRSGHVHFPWVRRHAWYSAHIVQSPSRENWTIARTEPRWVPAWPGQLGAQRLQPDLARLVRDLEQDGWLAEEGTGDPPLHFRRAVLLQPDRLDPHDGPDRLGEPDRNQATAPAGARGAPVAPTG